MIWEPTIDVLLQWGAKPQEVCHGFSTKVFECSVKFLNKINYVLCTLGYDNLNKKNKDLNV